MMKIWYVHFVLSLIIAGLCFKKYKDTGIKSQFGIGIVWVINALIGFYIAYNG